MAVPNTTVQPRYETRTAGRVFQAARQALLHADLTNDERGQQTAAEIARRVDNATRHRADPDLCILRDGDHDQLNRAEITHELRCLFPWDGTETQQAEAVLGGIEEALGVRFPEPTERQQFVPTSLSLWDKLNNRWACYECGQWVSGDSVGALSPQWCSCGHRVVG